MISPRSSIRKSLALILIGLALPLASLPFSTGCVAGDGFFKNMNHLYIRISKKKETPVFQVVKKGEENPAAQVVQFEDTQLFMEFSNTATIADIGRIVKARFPDNTLHAGDPQSGRIRFEGWDIHEAVTLPFRYIVIAGLFFVLLGLLFIFLAPTRNSHAA